MARLTMLVACATILTAGCGPKIAQIPSSDAVLKVAAVTTYTQAPGVAEPTRYANVFVNGRWVVMDEDGTATFHLEPGRHVVRFRALGFEVGADTLELRPGEVRTLVHRFVGTPLPKE